jgi:hypothetical protein
MSFRITGLSIEPFKPLFGLPTRELEAQGVRRMTVDADPGFPDRVSLTDVPVGESVLLLNHVSQPAPTPYRASHAIFVWESDRAQTYDRPNEVPEAMRRRLLSLRGFSADGTMVDADVTEGRDVEALIERLFSNEEVAVIHAHHAKRGCYAASIGRA